MKDQMMTAAKSDFRKYLDSAGELPRDCLLGNVVLFTIHDGQYDRDQIEKWFTELDLNPAFLPAPNNPLHAYEKATSKVDDTSYPLPDGREGHILVRDVVSDKEHVVRQLTREVRDGSRRRLAYDKVGEVVFYRPKTENNKVQYGSERIRLTVDNAALKPAERPAFQTVVDTITAEYDRHCRYMDGMKVRAMVREYLLYLNAISLKPSVYFVHVSRQDELTRLQELVSRLPGASHVDFMPLVDLKAQRGMVIEAYQNEATESLTKLAAKMTELKSARKKITPEAYGNIKAEYDRIMLRSKEYARTLRVSQDTTSGASEIALEALMALQRKMVGEA